MEREGSTRREFRFAAVLLRAPRIVALHLTLAWIVGILVLYFTLLISEWAEPKRAAIVRLYRQPLETYIIAECAGAYVCSEAFKLSTVCIKDLKECACCTGLPEGL